MTPDEQRTLAMLQERSEQHARDISEHGRRIAAQEERASSAALDRANLLSGQKALRNAQDRLIAQIEEVMTKFEDYINDTRKLSDPFGRRFWTGIGLAGGTLIATAAGCLVVVAKLFGWI